MYAGCFIRNDSRTLNFSNRSSVDFVESIKFEDVIDVEKISYEGCYCLNISVNDFGNPLRQVNYEENQSTRDTHFAQLKMIIRGTI